jgi:hypothetical protein
MFLAWLISDLISTDLGAQEVLKDGPETVPDLGKMHSVVTPFKILSMSSTATGTSNYGCKLTSRWIDYNNAGTAAIYGIISFYYNSSTSKPAAYVWTLVRGNSWSYTTVDLEFNKWYYFVNQWYNEGSGLMTANTAIYGPDWLDVTELLVSDSDSKTVAWSGNIDVYQWYPDVMNNNNMEILFMEPAYADNISFTSDAFHPFAFPSYVSDYELISEVFTDYIDIDNGNFEPVYIERKYIDLKPTTRYIADVGDDINIDTISIRTVNDKYTDPNSIVDSDLEIITQAMITLPVIGDYLNRDISDEDLYFPVEAGGAGSDLDPGGPGDEISLSEEIDVTYRPVLTDLSAEFGIE